jgi:hypothetical protein
MRNENRVASFCNLTTRSQGWIDVGRSPHQPKTHHWKVDYMTRDTTLTTSEGCIAPCWRSNVHRASPAPPFILQIVANPHKYNHFCPASTAMKSNQAVEIEEGGGALR